MEVSIGFCLWFINFCLLFTVVACWNMKSHILFSKLNSMHVSKCFWFDFKPNQFTCIYTIFYFSFDINVHNTQVRPKKYICVFTVTCQQNLGSVGRD